MSARYRRSFRALGRCLSIVALALGLIAAEAPIDGQPEQQGQQTEQPQEGQTQPPESALGAAPAIPAGESKGGEAKCEQQANPFEGFFHYLGIDGPAQWLMALAAIGALGVSIWAVVILRETLKQTVRAVAAGRFATRQTLKVVQENAHRELRAYVTVTKAAVENVLANKQPTAFLSLRNTGQTPAYDFHATVDMRIGPFPLPEGIQLPTAGLRVTGDNKLDAAQFSAGILGAAEDGHLKAVLDMPITSQLMAEMLAGSKALYVYGDALYRDAFKRRWELNFTYICGGYADTNALYVFRMDEKETKGD